MKSFLVLSLLATTLAAPTPTLEERQLSSGTAGSSGLSALASLFPSSSSSTSSGSGSSSSGSGSSSSGSSSSSGGGLSSLLSGLTSGSSTSSSANSGGCKKMTFIFARGTTEIGTMGTVVGPEVASKLQSLTGNSVSVEGVNYPADFAGIMTLGSEGASTMAQMVKSALSQCPNTKVVLGGYSQGSMVVHNAANQLSSGEVAAAVLFGDPYKMLSVGKIPSSKVKEFCASGDPVCENGVNVMAHLSYGADATEAAQFLVQAAGLS
ncbi:cutinase-domain-containing protein [Aspergillus ellipticus CBS 707.79]|uniref:Cutinase n=1 Tax=Aspergillus ellipticus CBS 707.79 TaxID=1448320 RepID=A0A319D0D1_9EURO|nr:cutinase-domain-containing protein [Aspergillus ellipticus CBS 707.79]